MGTLVPDALTTTSSTVPSSGTSLVVPHVRLNSRSRSRAPPIASPAVVTITEARNDRCIALLLKSCSRIQTDRLRYTNAELVAKSRGGTTTSASDDRFAEKHIWKCVPNAREEVPFITRASIRDLSSAQCVASGDLHAPTASVDPGQSVPTVTDGAVKETALPAPFICLTLTRPRNQAGETIPHALRMLIGGGYMAMFNRCGDT